jgi:hypothetical protein
VNVFTDMFNSISITYYAFMSVYIPLTRAAVSELCIPTVHCMEGAPVGGGGAGGGAGSGSFTGPGGTDILNRDPPAVEVANSTGVGGT